MKDLQIKVGFMRNVFQLRKYLINNKGRDRDRDRRRRNNNQSVCACVRARVCVCVCVRERERERGRERLKQNGRRTHTISPKRERVYVTVR